MTRAPDPVLRATEAIVKVGAGHGFIIMHDHQPLIVTAAHCLPNLPPAHPGSSTHERTYELLGALDDREPRVMAECLFADPIADLAVLGAPDYQLYEVAEADRYEALIEGRPALGLGEVSKVASAWVLRLDGCWTLCTVKHCGGPLQIEGASIQSGMSGSPIVTDDGLAVGAISTGNWGNPRLLRDLPMWLAPNI